MPLTDDGVNATPHRARHYTRPVEQPAEDESGVPSDATTIPEIKAWVGDDLERAQIALDAEQAKADDDQRVTLLDYLEGLLTEPDDDDDDDPTDSEDEPSDED
jgi:hypothetical protein